jgi:hypothetical protein
MATKRTKNSEDENLSVANIEKVIALLEPKEDGVKPITKKDACAILNIAYNTTRLAKLIEAYKEKKAATAAKRASLRGKPATPGEISFIISGYLEGQPIDALSEKTYRSSSLIKQILDKYSVPIRAKAHDYFRPELIPEGAMRDRFKEGEIVYSARYDSIARIDGEMRQKGQWVYRLWLISDKWQQFAYQEAAELASLEHLKEVGVTF